MERRRQAARRDRQPLASRVHNLYLVAEVDKVERADLLQECNRRGAAAEYDVLAVVDGLTGALLDERERPPAKPTFGLEECDFDACAGQFARAGQAGYSPSYDRSSGPYAAPPTNRDESSALAAMATLRPVESDARLWNTS